MYRADAIFDIQLSLYKKLQFTNKVLGVGTHCDTAFYALMYFEVRKADFWEGLNSLIEISALR